MNKTDRIAGRRGAGAANRLQSPTAPDSRDPLAQVSIGAGAASGQYARYTASCTDLPVQRQRVLRVVGGQIFLQRNELLFGPFLLSPIRSSPDGVSTAKRADLGALTGLIAPFGTAQMALSALFPGVYPCNLSLHALSGPGIVLEQDGPHSWAAQTGFNLQQRQIAATLWRRYPLAQAQLQGNMRGTPRPVQTCPHNVSVSTAW